MLAERLALGALIAFDALLGFALIVAATDVAEYAGGAALIGASVAGIYGLLHQLAKGDQVSRDYRELVDGLQRDNDRLRDALRACEEGRR